MIDELYLYSYANEPNKSPGRERLGALLPLRETATFPPQADHVLVVFFLRPWWNLGGCVKAPRHICLKTLFFLFLKFDKDNCDCVYNIIKASAIPLNHKLGVLFQLWNPLWAM